MVNCILVYRKDIKITRWLLRSEVCYWLYGHAVKQKCTRYIVSSMLGSIVSENR